jgi:hypothetical protein
MPVGCFKFIEFKLNLWVPILNSPVFRTNFIKYAVVSQLYRQLHASSKIYCWLCMSLLSIVVQFYMILGLLVSHN